MPILKSSIKKMRQDKKREARNDEVRTKVKGLVKNMRRTPSVKAYQEVSSALDKAVKTNLIHLNHASRLKSRLSKLIAKTTPTKTAKSKASSSAAA